MTKALSKVLPNFREGSGADMDFKKVVDVSYNINGYSFQYCGRCHLGASLFSDRKETVSSRVVPF